MRRRRPALVVLGVLLLAGCAAAGLSLVRGASGGGAGTLTVQVDVEGGTATARVLAGGASPGATQDPGSTGGPAGRGGSAPVLVTLSGSTGELVPGGSGHRLEVVVGNDAANEDDLLLTLTSVSAAARGRAGSCGPDDLVVTPYRAGPGAPTYTVRRGRSVVVPLEVVLVDRLDRDQTDCRGASFPLTLTVSAEVTA